MVKTIFVTGGAGFIGSALVRYLIKETPHRVVNIDKLTYSGHLESLTSIANDGRYTFAKVDICDGQAISALFAQHKPDAIMHLAAETHVDNSIDSPSEFIQTNFVGTYTLLECARRHWMTLPEEKKKDFRFLHVSTDEVYGFLGDEGYFTEETQYKPSSPYSASKAGSDHLVRAWHHTYGLPTLTTNCSNNYGPFQFPEKLMPVIITNALNKKPLPIYGTGKNVRDWLYVDDHVRALLRVLERGTVGETYCISGRSERNNLQVCNAICTLLDEMAPLSDGGKYSKLIQFVTDRPGHDWRYAIDPTKTEKHLDWRPTETFESGLRKTVRWYLDNQEWCRQVTKRK